MDELTQIGISVEMRDRVKIHVVKFKSKYGTMIDFINKAAEQLIEDDEHDADTTTIE